MLKLNFHSFTLNLNLAAPTRVRLNTVTLTIFYLVSPFSLS